MLGVFSLTAALLLGDLASTDWAPAARFRLRWNERTEMNNDVSGPSLMARGGVFPKLGDSYSAGLEISTSSVDGPSPASVVLSDGFSNKSIGFRQAFVETHWGSDWRWSVLLGKFSSPVLASPQLWDEEICPEGLFQSLETMIQNFKFAIYAAQYSVHQASASIASSTPMRRSWLFQQGALSSYNSSSEVNLTMTVNHYHFWDLSEDIADSSGSRGNTFVGTLGHHPEFRYEYSPIEMLLSASARPLGIQTGIQGAFTVNLRTPDQQRGFFLEAHLGNSWKPRNFFFSLSYYYSEPDMTVAVFTDQTYAHTNRKGARGEISYFVLKNLKFGISLFYSTTLSPSIFQATRKEARSEMELVF